MKPSAFLQPPATTAPDGSERTVGVEFEFTGVDMERAAQIVADLYDGTIEVVSSYELESPEAVYWEIYPGATSLFYYARGIGAARTGDLELAEEQQQRIKEAVAAMRDDGDVYWAYMTEALAKAVEGWILYERGETEAALAFMSEAADLEESMDKHPITPGEVYPVRELYGDMLSKEGNTEEAYAPYEKSLERTPNRRNALSEVERIAAL